MRQHVELLSDSYIVAANKPDEIELRFRIDSGLHINSHAPKDELLLPTAVKLESLHVLNVAYPAGKPFKLNVGKGELLDVYEGEFRVRVKLAAPKGTTPVSGVLRYQACDTASCFPPRTLPLRFVVTGQ
ncbi:protein-disulfide reductase DsbD domain-containing protein [Granulicella cerasi]|uniref:Protein-disulfide reductase DsbD domain-containing protein n=1 Tax=Granulicella cerasi TaxID=741063 RepID=A0ABW1Z7Q7_9BACT